MPTHRVLLLLGSVVVIGLTGCGGGGTAHLLGEEVSVQHTQTSGGPGAPTTTLGVSVLDVRKGAQADLDLAGLQVEPDDASKTPHYVRVRYENQGANAIERLLSVSLEDTDGELITATSVFDFGGPQFATCPGTTSGELAPGESIELCSIFLVPEGQEPVRVGFLPYDRDGETDWVYWNVT